MPDNITRNVRPDGEPGVKVNDNGGYSACVKRSEPVPYFMRISGVYTCLALCCNPDGSERTQISM